MKGSPMLICIPDISGFTEFMSETDFELSSKIIPALLNQIIYTNEIGLKVSEIEGDAVLFFKTGKMPSLEKLIHQCRVFYTEFYKELDALRKKHNDNADAASIPDILGLKIILHYGKEIALTKVGNSIKLFGEDLIVAHKLLKNKVKINDYLLLTEGLANHYKENNLDDHFDWASLKQKSTFYDHVGEVNYYYIDLKPLVNP
ncbi:DUF2652 domain-containing protein [Maribacter sp. MAR_2009_72]|uniref:DUF2652 domain-containing protein n=1 Tax=Maribacter sp. MAR_2009_72 TaxID=1250050 RepID=UPI00119A88CE|nr:DUF2652 domain-containing protein [Maribacter sp. MAR_2009_72]TVZ16054.1 uncharacterized protein DUF2652 [Maribacter sp. MAR_2009_72]